MQWTRVNSETSMYFNLSRTIEHLQLETKGTSAVSLFPGKRITVAVWRETALLYGKRSDPMEVQPLHFHTRSLSMYAVWGLLRSPPPVGQEHKNRCNLWHVSHSLTDVRVIRMLFMKKYPLWPTFKVIRIRIWHEVYIFLLWKRAFYHSLHMYAFCPSHPSPLYASVCIFMTPLPPLRTHLKSPLTTYDR